MLEKHPRARQNKSKILVFVLVLLSLSLAGCTSLIDFENNQVQTQDAVGSFGSGETLGQSFLIRRQPLTGIQLWLRPDEPIGQSSGTITVTLSTTKDPTTILYSGQISNNQIAQSYPILIKFSPISLNTGELYQINLATNSGRLSAFGRAEDIYPFGNAFTSTRILDGDLAFRLEYDYSFLAAREDLTTLLSLSIPILIILAILLIPGWLLFRSTNSALDLGPICQIGMMIGLSVAIIPVIMTWTTYFSIPWNGTIVRYVYIASGLLILFMEVRHWRAKTVSSHEHQLESPMVSGDPQLWKVSGLIIILFLGALFLRFAMIRDLSAPAWVDPVHHTLINRIIVQDGLLPDTFLPYADAPAENYHTGYHATAAVVTWLSGLDELNTQLILGQVLNALCIFAVYLLTYTLTNSRLAAVAGALLTGFVTPMPAYYTSWGRYTQLAGLLILPAAFVFTRRLYTKPLLPDSFDPKAKYKQSSNIWKTIMLAALLFAGLFLVHVRVAAFFACLIVVDFLIEIYVRRKYIKEIFQTILFRFVAVGAFAVVFSAPLFFRVIGQVLPQRISDWNSGSPGSFNLPWQFLTAGSGRLALVLAGLGLLLAIYFRPRFFTTITAWIALMALLAYAPQLGLPINGFVSSDSVMITLFLPISAAGGFAIASLRKVYSQDDSRASKIAGGVLLIVLGIFAVFFGGRSIIGIINPVTTYFKLADERAAHWVEENLPPDTTIMINPAKWGYGMYVGSDGGYWISPLSGRLTFPPTLLYAHGQPEEYSKINRQVREVLASVHDPADLAQNMKRLGSDYLYLGAQGGLISPKLILESPLFEIIYHEDGVWIFRLVGNIDND